MVRTTVEELFDSPDNYRVIVDSAEEGIWVADADAVIMFVNKKVVDMLGYDKEQILGKKMYDFTDDENRAIMKESLEDSRKGKRDNYAYSIRNKRGEFTPMMVATTPMQDAKGEFIGTVEFMSDISMQKKYEKELRDAQEQASMYIDLMSHDINNLNQTAMGYLELAFEAKTLDEAKELMKKPFMALKNSSELIENVSKLKQAKTKSLKYHAIDLCDVFKGLVEEYSHISGKDVVINFKPLDRCYVVANSLIRDVFSNLISNAIKHSEGVRPLIINISIDPFDENRKKYYKVMVEDNGPGIPDELKGRIFGKFQRGKTNASGKGLGLFLVYTLVGDFQGKVWVEDRVQGDYTKGARFVVTLPVAEK